MDDHEQLQGFWKLTASTLNGQPWKHADLGTVFEFTGNRFRHIRSRVSHRFELHPETNPKGIDFIIVATKGVAPAIYELNDDTLRIQPAGIKQPRPTKFADVNYPTEIYIRYKKKVPIKRRVKAQIPKSALEGGFMPRDLVDDLTKRNG